MFVESNNEEENTNGDTNGDTSGDISGNYVVEETVFSIPPIDTTTPQGM